MLYRLNSEVMREGGEGREGEMLSLHTDLLGQNHGGLLTLGGTQNCGASLQLLLLLLGVGQLEAFLFLNIFSLSEMMLGGTYCLLSAGHGGNLDRFVFTFPLRHRVSHSHLGLGRAYPRHVGANLSVLLPAAASSVAGGGRRTGGSSGLRLALHLVVHSEAGGLRLLALLAVDEVADLIVHLLLRLSADSPHQVHTVLPGLQGVGLDQDLLALPLYGGTADLQPSH